ncbi:MAG: sensor histidine kinase, partial [Actinomycetota bacterium]
DSCELELTNPRDPQQRLFVQVEAASDRAGQTLRMAAVDITEKKRATEELVRSNLELQRFAYVAAHDLQTPLRSIHGFVQLLQKELGNQGSDQMKSWMSQIIYQVQRMHILVQDLLSYSRVDSRGSPFEPVDLNRVVDEFLASARVVLAEQGAEVGHDPLPTVIGDRIQLSQLFQNLIDNGIKYQDGKPPRIHISACRELGEWVVSVEDNGIGIAAKHHQRIFDIFHRLHSQQAYPGTGIGLAVCRRIVHRHGGRIWVESEPGRGSTFRFTLPDSRDN